MRKKRKAKTGKGVNIVLLIILVPMLGTLLGYAISQKVLIPYLVEKEDAVQGTAAADETPKGDAVPAEADQSKPVVAYQRMIDIEGMSIYCVQVGAFSSRDNAERMLEELKDKGFAG
ncbi:MAG: SPOR domain-containing protein, partial [Bacillota bacterium]|nr:SPOR domain-containing protein [Bacillota bacterium]